MPLCGPSRGNCRGRRMPAGSQWFYGRSAPDARACWRQGYRQKCRGTRCSGTTRRCRYGCCKAVCRHLRSAAPVIKPRSSAMSERAIITRFDEKDAVMWGNEPICIGHSLHRSPLFGSETLAQLIESYPREHYNIFSMGSQANEPRYWRQGDLDGMSGKDVLEAIAKGRLWLNLRNVNKVDRRYAQLLDDLMDELG